uniref:DnaJ heat shock protein family (Hsp40) member C4 n=1 Tax=Mus musculus TaxID=10090 RepID=A0A494B9W8_MOUSE
MPSLLLQLPLRLCRLWPHSLSIRLLTAATGQRFGLFSTGLSLLITMNCWACIRVPALKRLNVLFSPSQKSYTLIETLGTQPCIAALWS